MLDNFFSNANLVESILWFVIGVCFLVSLLVSKSYRAEKAIAVVLFVSFGISDLVEIHTGGWYKPWWLFVWKAIDVLGFVWLLARYRRCKKQSTP